ncbi:cbb3-type cytochrome oxidase assembly protein CcoS [Shewanella surugensis]|uniref:Cbb3-type cytochrome oxidase assembly protein CcoS n=1 Tax=Shewanella surugensis TaxID=212020 RepID=A0ABT0LE69_9GAMM|nr:cbb3-type cytochrome oxidase assembly protein CcoS [Shewanella surugensis]MCL1125983.1 cbb3-type cytochrome oxidase assembly protein CcoS [Shewanella surugensis]
MSIIYILIPIAIIFVIIAICLFFWAVRSDQFDDLDKQSVSILFDYEPSEVKSTHSQASRLETKMCDNINNRDKHGNE